MTDAPRDGHLTAGAGLPMATSADLLTVPHLAGHVAGQVMGAVGSAASSIPPPPESEEALASIAPVAPASQRVAFRAMYEHQVDFVWRNLRRLGVSEAEVDDKTQEVFVIAHRRWGE